MQDQKKFKIKYITKHNAIRADQVYILEVIPLIPKISGILNMFDVDVDAISRDSISRRAAISQSWEVGIVEIFYFEDQSSHKLIKKSTGQKEYIFGINV